MLKINKRLIKKNLTISNFLTVLRVIGSSLIPVIYFMVSQNIFLVYCGMIAITDAFDGYLARRLHQRTKFGRYLDPIADRFYSIMIVFTFFITALVSPIILLMTLSRELLAIPALIYSKFKGRKYVANAGIVGKITTNLQMITFILLILAGGSVVTTIFVFATFISGAIAAFVYSQRTGAMVFFLALYKKFKFF